MKKTKRSLFTSLVTLLLCSAMFVGSTFAWFTDTVSNTGNKIQAGTLKIDLLQNKDEDFTDENKYVSIKGQTEPVFNSGEGTELLWEPGQTQVAYLAVKNNGNLALKYNIILDVVDRETNEDLTQAMAGAFNFAIIDSGSEISTKISSWSDVSAYSEKLLDAIHAAAQSDTAKSARITAAPNGKLLPDEKDYFAIAIHMNEEAGNAYQKGLIEFDVNVVATQDTVEKDGFNNDQYDAGAIFDKMPARIEGKSSSNPLDVNTNEGKISTSEDQIISINSASSSGGALGSATVPVNAVNNIPTGKTTSVVQDLLNKVEDVTDATTITDIIVLNLNVNTKEATTSALVLDVTMDGKITRTTKVGDEPEKVQTGETKISELANPVTVSIQLENNLENVKLIHTHDNVSTEMEKVDTQSALADGKFHYNKVTGLLKFMTSKFSDFKVEYTKQADKTDNYDVWDGTIDTSWYSSEKTEFTLTKASELAGLAKIVNDMTDDFGGKSIVLANDIDLNYLNWKPIGLRYTKEPFAGNFDGCNHRIINMRIVSENGELEGYYEAGFFGCVGRSGTPNTIKNIVFENALVMGQRTGVCAGEIQSNPTKNGAAIIDNIKVYDSVVTGVQKNGSIVGYTRYCTDVSITNCVVENVVFNSEYNYQTGGLIGCIYLAKNGVYNIANNSISNVSMTHANDTDSHPLIGQLRNESSASGYLLTINNNGVSGNNTGFPVGDTTTEYCGSHQSFNGTVTYNGVEQ